MPEVQERTLDVYSDTLPIKLLCSFTPSEDPSCEDSLIEQLRKHFIGLADYVASLQQQGFNIEDNGDPAWLTFTHTDKEIFDKHFHWEEVEVE